MSEIDPSDFEKLKQFSLLDDKEAERKFDYYKDIDPFPEIESALLNSADIIDYVITTGIICPFEPGANKDRMKPASYGVPILGKCVYFNEKGEKEVKEIKEGDEYIIKDNSIAFLTLQPRFRIPNYIALRFNLQIMNVYRGLLVGTGPLVDPGYNGFLTIPLHNLTTNEYKFKGGEDVVYFEFTKLSKNIFKEPSEEKLERKGLYVTFPDWKNKRGDVEHYLAIAAPNMAIRSSIPEAIKVAEDSAKKASHKVTILTGFGIAAIIVASISLFGILIQIHNLIESTSNYISSVQEKQILFQDKINSRIDTIEKNNMLLIEVVDSLKNNMGIKNNVTNKRK